MWGNIRISVLMGRNASMRLLITSRGIDDHAWSIQVEKSETVEDLPHGVDILSSELFSSQFYAREVRAILRKPRGGEGLFLSEMAFHLP